jgi:hypothetical protein
MTYLNIIILKRDNYLIVFRNYNIYLRDIKLKCDISLTKIKLCYSRRLLIYFAHFYKKNPEIFCQLV